MVAFLIEIFIGIIIRMKKVTCCSGNYLKIKINFPLQKLLVNQQNVDICSYQSLFICCFIFVFLCCCCCSFQSFLYFLILPLISTSLSFRFSFRLLSFLSKNHIIKSVCTFVQPYFLFLFYIFLLIFALFIQFYSFSLFLSRLKYDQTSHFHDISWAFIVITYAFIPTFQVTCFTFLGHILYLVILECHKSKQEQEGRKSYRLKC